MAIESLLWVLAALGCVVFLVRTHLHCHRPHDLIELPVVARRPRPGR